MNMTGTTSGRVQSAVLIPVPEAEVAVGDIRREHDPSAVGGVPAHITLLVPWLPPDEIHPAELEILDEVLAEQPAFDFTLTDVGWFDRSVLWLAPSPAEPFRRLTSRLAEVFGTPPWDDEFDEVVPHLTVALASDGSELALVADKVRSHLPLACRARQARVMITDGSRWHVVHEVELNKHEVGLNKEES